MVNLCERFDFRVYQLLRRQPRAGQSQLFRAGYDFYRNRDAQTLENSLRQNIFKYCNDLQFQQQFNDETADWYRWNGLKYFLYEYERYKAEQARKPVLMPWEILLRSKKEDTIEHILPQNPEQSYWTERFGAAARKRWTHDIGNLTLTYDNSPLGRKPFRAGKSGDDKVGLYANSKLFIEQELKDVKHWNADEIKRRREAIRAWATQRWHVEPPAEGMTEPDEDMSAMETTFARADEMGVHAEMEELITLIKKYGFHVRLYKRCIMCAPPFKKIQALFTVWMPRPRYFRTGIWHEAFEELYQVPLTETIDMLGAKQQHFDASEMPAFLERLESMLIHLTTKKD
jgi:hypothetical protein